LLGAPPSFAAAYPADDVSKHGFATANNTSELMATAVMETSEALASFAVQKVDSLVPCAASANEACAKDLIDKIGQRAFRRPLNAAEKQDLLNVYLSARSDLALDFKNAVRLLLSAVLQSPQFLYHWEQGEDSGALSGKDAVQLGAFHLASRLSYFLWGSMPDVELFSAAADGSLTDASTLERQARRLLDDPRSRGMVGDFFTQLLYLDAAFRNEKDSKAHPEWTPVLRAAAVAESRTFVQDVVLDGDGLWRTLMLSKQSFIDEGLSRLYGAAPVSGNTLTKVELPSTQRSGLLTQAAFLSAHSGPTEGAMVTPIHRGQMIRKRLLCESIPPPLANIQSRASSGNTTRERLKSHVGDPQCATCHVFMDELGFAFENYDVTGKWRATENGVAVDASGEISGVAASDATFGNAIELATLLTDLPESTECVVSNLLRYGLGRIDTDGEAKFVMKSLDSSNLNIRDALIRVATSRGFTERLLSQGEVLP
ncbi:MAG: DUF1592 domain-containing protein, partial [Deltaproteobacteria bacterium]|nr:DUF1592 domain-containing protein [Deltaproteobacteria bacterium]